MCLCPAQSVRLWRRFVRQSASLGGSLTNAREALIVSVYFKTYSHTLLVPRAVIG